MRVISGRFKSLPLTSAQSCTRPTTDRTKEAIFSRLDSWNVLENARVLDLFAGTGALGVEALSRGSRELVSVEANAQAAALIQRTAKLLQNSREWNSDLSMRVVRKRAEQFVNDYSGAAFNLVFIDPPYAYETSECENLLNKMCERGVISVEADTLVVLERSVRSISPNMPDGLELFDTRDYGETAVLYIQPKR